MKIADVVDLVLASRADVEFSAYDGSRTGRPGSDVRIEIRSPRAMAAVIAAPGQLGLARAYVDGDLDVVGDMYTAFERLGALPPPSLTVAEKARVLREFAPLVVKRPPVPRRRCG